MMHFEFIDNNSALCRAAKRRIRTHAAKEKNLGRTLVRPSKKKVLSRRRELVQELPLSLRLAIPQTSSSFESEQEDVPALTTVGRQLGDGLSGLSFTADLSLEPRELVQKAISLFGRVHYMPELCKAFKAHRGPQSMWFQLALEDEAYFHVFMATSAVSLDSTPIGKDDPVLAARHLNITFHLTNQRLSSTDAVSDASLAVVVMMAQYERQRERYIKGLTHIDGLQRMVEMRGGISQLARDKPSLFQKIIRLDLDYALYLGRATRFSIAHVADGCRIWSWFLDSSEGEFERRPSRFGHLDTLGSELQDLAFDVTRLAWLVNDANTGRRPALIMQAFHGTLLLIGYRLIHFSPLGGPCPISDLENAVHLGLVAFMMPFMYRFDGRIPESLLLSRLIRSVVQQNFMSTDENIQETLLWILLVGAPSAFIQPLDGWTVPLVSQIMHSLRLHTWEDVSRTMAKYPWIDTYHTDPAQALCREQDLYDQCSLATGLGGGTVSPDLASR